jgi:hypothetical protein
VPGPAAGAKPAPPEGRAAKQGQQSGSGAALPAGAASGRQRTSGGGAAKAGRSGKAGEDAPSTGALELPEIPGVREGGFRLPVRRADSSGAIARGSSPSRRPAGCAGRAAGGASPGRSRDASPSMAPQPPAAPTASAAALLAAGTIGARPGAELAREFFGSGSLAKGIDWASTLQAAAGSEESPFETRGFSPKRPAPGGPCQLPRCLAGWPGWLALGVPSTCCAARGGTS